MISYLILFIAGCFEVAGISTLVPGNTSCKAIPAGKTL